MKKVTEDLSGQKFGRLLVLRKNKKMSRSRGWSYHCQCDCGKEVSTPVGAKLKNGCTASCGCLRKENVRLGQQYGNRHPAWTGHEGLTGAKWSQIVSCAKQRTISIELTIAEAWAQFVKQAGKCALTGEALKLPVTLNDMKTSVQTASLDRIDSTKPYTPDNVQWVHKNINYMKASMAQTDFIDWCKKVAAHAAV